MPAIAPEAAQRVTGDRAPAGIAPAAATCEFVEPAAAAALVEEWRALARDGAEANAFYEPSFLMPALDAFAHAGVALAVIRDARGQLIGLAPVAPLKGYSRLPVRYMATWMHQHCFFAAPLVRRGAEQAFFTALFRLMDARGAFFRLRHLDAEGPLYKAAIEAARADGRLVAPSARYARAKLKGSYRTEAQLENALSGKKRKELRRLRARLLEEGEIAFEKLADPALLSQWAEEFLALEASGWKGGAGTALASDEASSRFFRASVAAAFATDELHFARLTVGGRTIAMAVSFYGRQMGADALFEFKIAFDEAYARYSPGVMLEIEIMRDLERRPNLLFIDSCAQAGHPMIERLWRDRRTIEALNVSRRDFVGKAIFRVLMALERASERRRAAIAAKAPAPGQGGDDDDL